MSSVRMKCCGVTSVADALLAAELGFDAIGLVFAERSQRRINIEQAREIRRALPPMVSAVALFMDNDAAQVRAVIDQLRPDLLQFHGNENDDSCVRFGVRYIKAIAMGEGAAALPRLSAFPGAAALLLDGNAAGQGGGLGHAFDWSLVPRHVAQPVILAGGLDADNVGAALCITRPWAVDVSSGVESAPGRKDGARMRRFVEAVRRYEQASAAHAETVGNP